MMKFSFLITILMVSCLGSASYVIENRSVTAIKLNQSAMSAGGIRNLGVSASVASSALTVTLTPGNTLTTISASNPVDVGFRSSTLTFGSYSQVSFTTAPTLTVASGATLGTANGVNANLYLYAISSSGTGELAIINGSILDEGLLWSTTALSGSSNTAGVLYSTTARTNVPVRLIGRFNITETTAGTWVTAPISQAPAPFKTNVIPAEIDAGPIVVTGTSSNPTAGVTSANHFWWRPNGTKMDVRIEFIQTSATGSAAGSGNYLLQIPASTGCTIDSSRVTFDTNLTSPVLVGSNFGSSYLGLSNPIFAIGIVYAYDTTHVSTVFRDTNEAFWGSTNYVFSSATMALAWNFSVPCVGPGWTP